MTLTLTPTLTLTLVLTLTLTLTVTRRAFCDADAYCTAAGVLSSASLGWHVDDVDVLLVMCRGRKRFRVAGRGFGSPVVIDTVLEPGDALYIPALTFHTGGELKERARAPFRAPWPWPLPRSSPPPPPAEEEEDGGSLMLSVALPWAEVGAAAAADAAEHWRQAVDDLAQAGLRPACNRWSYAASGEGRAQLASLLSDEAASRFLLED